MEDKILDKVRKLLKLSESSNANEAAAAAAKAQQLIDEYNLSAALLAVETDQPEDNEPIDIEDKPLYQQKQLRTWIYALAEAIANCNSCQIYHAKGAIELVGRKSDAEKVRYLFGYLVHETERLCDRDGLGCGRTWRNNYRLGVVDTIKSKLKEQHRAFKDQAREQVSSDSLALVKVDKALARIEAKDASVADWSRRNLRLGSSFSHCRGNQFARQAGRLAGQSISIGKARAALK